MTSQLLEQQQDIPVSSDDDNFRQYLREIRRFPRLTVEQERELAQRCAEGDEEAIRQMVSANLRLVVFVAMEYADRGVPLLDLIQEGSVGLLAAAKKFDCTLDYRFSTYATKWIKQGVNRCLLNHGGMIRVPLHTAEKMRKIRAAGVYMQQETGKDATLEQIAEICEMPVEKVEQLKKLIPEVCSLDSPVGDEEDGTLALLLEDTQSPQPYEELVREELNQTIGTMLGALKPNQQQVVRLRYGMEDGICYSLEQIAGKMGLSKERIRQIEHKAIEKLQDMGSEFGLEDFLL